MTFETPRKERKPRHLIPVDFNPAWLDENGFMTNVPFRKDFLSTFKLPAEATHVIGYYPLEVTGTDGNGHSVTRGKELYRFTIGATEIRQDMPFIRTAVITRNSITVLDHQGRVMETWRPFMGLTEYWQRTMRVMPNYRKPEAAQVPARMGNLYDESWRVMEKTVRLLGLNARLEDGSNDAALTEFKWIYVIRAVVDDLRAQDESPWLSQVPPAQMRGAWMLLVHIYDQVAACSAAERADPVTQQKWIDRLKVLAYDLTARFPAARRSPLRAV